MMYHNVLQAFHDVLLCLTMFYELHNDQHRRNGDHAATDHLRDRDNSTGIGDNSAEIGDDTASLQGSSISPRKWSHAKLHP